MKFLCGIFVLIAGCALVPAAVAGDLITSRGELEDPSGALTISDVMGRVTAPGNPAHSADSTKCVHWVCLRVRKPASGNRVVLFIRPTYLNEVRLYEAGPGDPLSWKTRVTGNHYPFENRDRAAISLGFVVEVGAPEATYYLRVRTRSPSHIAVEALEPEEADRKDHQRDLVIVFFATSMLSLLLWAVLSYLLDRQRVTALFALHQATYTMFGIVATGYLTPFSPARFPQLVDWGNMILYFGITFTTLLFVRELFRAYDPPAAMMRGLTLFLWICPALVAASLLGHDIFAINGSALLLKISLLYFVVVSFALRVEGTPSRRLLQAFFITVLLNNTIFWFAARSTYLASRINISAVQVLIVDGLIIGGLFAVMLHARARQSRKIAQQAALDLLLVQKKFEIEQELKKRAEVQARTDYLTGIFNRRYFVELAERELARSIRFHRPFALLMVDVDHFKSINDAWGHSVGDVVLQQVSQLMRHAIRDEDIFGRTGGEEFTAVIVETDGDCALQIAQRLCSTVAAARIDHPDRLPLQVTISIGLTQLMGRNISFDTILKEADSALYRAKQEGRNRVAVHEVGAVVG